MLSPTAMIPSSDLAYFLFGESTRRRLADRSGISGAFRPDFVLGTLPKKVRAYHRLPLHYPRTPPLDRSSWRREGVETSFLCRRAGQEGHLARLYLHVDAGILDIPI